jgi:glyoxylase-like metal-dependent hydrolase (beta-lactamase superfamily II)
MSRQELVPLGPGIFALPTSIVEGWSGLLAGQRRTLVLDAGKDLAEGRRLARAAATVGRPADLLAYSHGHWDHAGGGAAFAQAEVVAHADSLTMVLDQLVKSSEAELESAPAKSDRGAGHPSLVVSGEVRFELGGLEARLYPTPGHAPGAMSLLVPEAGVLFAGDTAVTAIPPAFSDGNSLELELTLRDLARLDLEVLVPGHGEIVYGTSAIRESLSWLADYLASVREQVGRLAPTHTGDEIVALTDYPTFVGDRLRADRHRMVFRHEQNVRRILVELGAGASA